jgi:hypothetical protein
VRARLEFSAGGAVGGVRPKRGLGEGDRGSLMVCSLSKRTMKTENLHFTSWPFQMSCKFGAYSDFQKGST